MNFLKNLFSGAASGDAADKRGFYVYVRPKRCEEIVEVRIDLYNDLSLAESGNGYFVRKIAQAIRCPFSAEVYLEFNKSRKVTDSTVKDGEIVTADEYAAWLAEKEA